MNEAAPKDAAEAAAFAYVPRLTGTTLEHFDRDGRQGAVDALLHYADGRTAALEVTSAAGEGWFQLQRLLHGGSRELPNPGKWHWWATITHPRDVPRLLERYERIILKSEELGIRFPEQAYELWEDPDFHWLMESDVTLHGAPSESSGGRAVWLSEGGIGGFVDEELAGFPGAVEELLATEQMQRRIDKLARSGQEEQHLFVLADQSGLETSVAMGMITSTMAEPPGRPPLPPSVTHLWLLVRFSPYLLLGTEQGWTRFGREQLA